MTGPPTSDRRRWAVLAVICTCNLLIISNSASLNVALPTLSRQLHATASELQWIVAAYSLIFAGFLFSSGTLGDRFGRKGALQGGLLLFMAAAGAASQATEAWQVIACRGVMGLAAALVMPATLSTIMAVFPAHERPKAIAFWAAVTGVAGTLGPLTSGFLLAHFSFGAVFLINIPIGAVAFLSGWVLIPRTRDPHGTKLDPAGAGLSIVAIMTFVYALIAAPDAGWLSGATLGAFAVSAVAGVTFVWWERRCPTPMLDLAYFRNRGFSVGMAGMVVAFLALFGSSYLLAQHFQLVMGFSPLGTAVRFLPTGILLVCVSPFTPRLSRRFGAHRVAGTGLLLILGSMLLLLPLQVSSPYLLVLASMSLLLVGLGFSLSPLTASVMAAVPADRPGAGSATNNSTRELGGALGVAVLGSLAASVYTSQLGGATASLPPADQALASSSLVDALELASTLPPAAGQALTEAAQAAFVDGLRLSALVPSVLAAVAVVVVWRFLPRSLTPATAMGSGRDSVEVAAELALGGALPAFADAEARADQLEAERRGLAGASPDEAAELVAEEERAAGRGHPRPRPGTGRSGRG